MDSQREFSHQATIDDIYYAYRLFLGRHPDPAGLEYYRDRLSTGITIAELTQNLLVSEEYVAKKRDDESTRLVDIDGMKIYVKSNDYDVGVSIRDSKQYEPHVTKVLKTLLKRNQAFLDVGANIGFFSLLGASLVGKQGQVISVEPNPANTQLLLRSVLENGFTNVYVLPFAASDREAVFEVITGGGSNGTVRPAKADDRRKLLSQSVILDPYLEKYGKIDVMKIDIEGHELKAVAGCRNMIRKFKPPIVTEFHPKALHDYGNTEPQDYLDLLYGIHKTVSIIERNGSIVHCADGSQIMAYWKRVNEEANAGDLIHLDLVAHSGTKAWL